MSSRPHAFLTKTFFICDKAHKCIIHLAKPNQSVLTIKFGKVIYKM